MYKCLDPNRINKCLDLYSINTCLYIWMPTGLTLLCACSINKCLDPDSLNKGLAQCMIGSANAWILVRSTNAWTVILYKYKNLDLYRINRCFVAYGIYNFYKINSKAKQLIGSLHDLHIRLIFFCRCSGFHIELALFKIWSR